MIIVFESTLHPCFLQLTSLYSLYRELDDVGAPISRHPDCLVWSFPTTLHTCPKPTHIHMLRR